MDVFRGLGILLMVMGHIGFGGAFDKFIHAFHMPMFFFVSGYFYRKKDLAVREYFAKKKTVIVIAVYLDGSHLLWSMVDMAGASAGPGDYPFVEVCLPFIMDQYGWIADCRRIVVPYGAVPLQHSLFCLGSLDCGYTDLHRCNTGDCFSRESPAIAAFSSPSVGDGYSFCRNGTLPCRTIITQL